MKAERRKKLCLCTGAGILLAALAAGMPAAAEEEPETFTEGQLTYAYTDGGVSVVDAADEAESIVIPKTAGGEPVISIGTGAFENCAQLQQIDIQADLTEIADGAFFYCISLEELDIPETVTQIGAYAFANCYTLHDITLPRGLKTLPGYAFYYDIGLKEVTLPAGMEQISSMSFVSCYALETLHIPASVTQIADLAVVSCMGLTNIDVDPANHIYRTDSAGALFTADYSTLLLYPAGRQEESYTVPESVNTIAQYAFSGAIKLTEIRLPDSVTSIGAGAFSDCRNLASFKLPPKLTAVPSSILADCESLTAFTIPETVTAIEEYAFYGCTKLSEITIPESVSSIGSYAFCGCTALPRIFVPDTVTDIGDYAFGFTPNEEADSAAAEPLPAADFVLSGSARSTAKAYAAANGIAFDQKGLSMGAVAALVLAVLLILIILTVLQVRRKQAPASAEADPAPQEAASDPHYSSILADDNDDEDPYDRSYGIQPDDMDESE